MSMKAESLFLFSSSVLKSWPVKILPWQFLRHLLVESRNFTQVQITMFFYPTTFWCKSEPVPVVVHNAHSVFVCFARGDVQGAQLLGVGERQATGDVDTFHDVFPSASTV